MRIVMVVAASLIMLTGTAAADWSDNFDSYATGSQIVGQGGWEEWGAGAGALVSGAYSLSDPNSVEVVGATDIVHQYPGYNTGHWTYTAWNYIPDDFVSSGDPSGSYFIMLNTYEPPTYDWSVQMGFNSQDGMIHGDCGSSNSPRAACRLGVPRRRYWWSIWSPQYHTGTGNP